MSSKIPSQMDPSLPATCLPWPGIPLSHFLASSNLLLVNFKCVTICHLELYEGMVSTGSTGMAYGT